MKLKYSSHWMLTVVLIVGTLTSVFAQPVVKLRNLEEAPGANYRIQSNDSGKAIWIMNVSDEINVVLTPIGYVPASFGNTLNLNNVVVDPNGDIWIIDSAGDAVQIGSTTVFSGSWNDLDDIPAGFADGTDNVQDSDSDPTNEIQLSNQVELSSALAINGDVYTNVQSALQAIVNAGVGTGGGFSGSWNDLTNVPAGFADDTDDVDDADADPTNEIQQVDTFTLNGTTLALSLSNDGAAQSEVDLSALQDGTGTDDQTAAEVSVSPIANLTATDVQAALAEHQSDIDAFVGGGTDDQTAAEVPITDAGGYFVATDVEAALQEEAVNRIALDQLVGDLITLSGVPITSQNLGTFTGTTITDDNTVKGALQELETAVEVGGGGLVGYVPYSTVISVNSSWFYEPYTAATAQNYTADTTGAVYGSYTIARVDFTNQPVTFTGDFDMSQLYGISSGDTLNGLHFIYFEVTPYGVAVSIPTNLSAAGGGNPTDEIQSISLDSTGRVFTLTLTDGGSVTWEDQTAAGGSSVWTESGNDIYYNTGAVSIGTASAEGVFNVVGNVGTDVGTNNLIFGDNFNSLTSGGNNVGEGFRNFYVLGVGSNNVGQGSQNYLDLTAGSTNVGQGINNFANLIDGDNNVGQGTGNFQTIATSSDYNIGQGDRNFSSLTSGAANVGQGYLNFQDLQIGSYNYGSGQYAFQDLLNGSFNTGHGSRPFQLTQNGSWNFGAGEKVFRYAKEAYCTFGGGFEVGPWLSGDTTANYSFVWGYQAFKNATQADDVIGIGYKAGENNTYLQPILFGRNTQAAVDYHAVVGGSNYTRFSSGGYHFNVDQSKTGLDGYVLAYNESSDELELQEETYSKTGIAAISGDAGDPQEIVVTPGTSDLTGLAIILTVEGDPSTLSAQELQAVISSRTTTTFTISLFEGLDAGESVNVNWIVHE